MATNPFDYSAMMKMFDPDEVSKMFNPSRMFEMFEPQKSAAFDMSSVMDSNRKNFDTMIEANKAAANAYKDLLEKQMDIFGQLTAAAREQAEWIEKNAGPAAMTEKTEAYGEAVEKALGLMRKLADAARDANEEAYASIRSQINEAVEGMKAHKG
ncbi:phasin family protein [Qingshengfaniella alkalisoli]|uniref:Phasin domain-containing protein n=1 Tax=Qingshengfaniella alkalisoli TaxID=2599296 RepID=A0A5B8I7S2_9RHOB|nr:phasin family protein [Qingshengfaniella alkalisoli]QDY69659.1 hypothetical protein FPZ52_08510 [Qingshengfaniella alkalisoli]